MKKNKKSKILFLVFCLVVCRCGKDPVTPDDIDTLLNQMLEATDIPSVVACIMKNDQAVWKYSYGFADIDQSVEATDETIYTLASISKVVTATAVMQLSEQDLIDLDGDINQYLSFPVRNPQYPDEKVTPRMLLTHRSGLAWPNEEDPNFYRTYPGDSAPPLFPWIREYIVPGGSEYVSGIWKNTPPGGQELYSNIGAALLGHLVEAVSGEDFNEYCKSHIFWPLDMFDTSFKLTDLDMNKVAIPYNSGKRPYDHYSVKFYPSTTLRTSTNDFSHFLLAFMNGGVYNGKRILKESTIDEMLRKHYPDSQVGLIWFLFSDGWFGHGGSFRGIRTEADFNKDDKVGFFIFSNGEDGSVNRGGLIYNLLRAEAGTYR